VRAVAEIIEFWRERRERQPSWSEARGMAWYFIDSCMALIREGSRPCTGEAFGDFERLLQKHAFDMGMQPDEVEEVGRVWREVLAFWRQSQANGDGGPEAA
jgi:hypothetical protein